MLQTHTDTRLLGAYDVDLWVAGGVVVAVPVVEDEALESDNISRRDLCGRPPSYSAEPESISYPTTTAVVFPREEGREGKWSWGVGETEEGRRRHHLFFQYRTLASWLNKTGASSHMRLSTTPSPFLPVPVYITGLEGKNIYCDLQTSLWSIKYSKKTRENKYINLKPYVK